MQIVKTGGKGKPNIVLVFSKKQLQIFLVSVSCWTKTRFVSSVIHELNARDPSRVSSKDLCALLQSLVILGKHCSHTRSQVTQAHMRRCFEFLKISSFKIWTFLERCRCLSLRLRKLLHLRPMARVLLQGLYAEGLRRSNTFSAKAGKRTGCPKVFKLK